MRYWVYIHTCPNGKKYVGVTSQSPKQRWGKDGAGYSTQLFGKAILKYGWDNIQHEVFEVESKEEMYRKEVELISFYHSNDPQYGYNCSEGGEASSKGVKKTEETRKKMSESHKGIPQSEETRKRMSESKKGHLTSEETRKKISESKKGIPQSEETRKRMSLAHKGKPSPKKGKPQPHKKVTFSLPDGTVREMSIQNMKKLYLNKGIEIKILE